MEEDKAVIEVGKEVVKRAFNFLELIIEPPLKEVGLLAQDQIKYWRFKNQVNILNKTQDFLNKKGKVPQKVPLKTIVPLLENGSLEEDPTMQQRWSLLLAKAADPKLKNEPILAHIEILKQISPVEAKILDIMYEYHYINTQKIIDHKDRDNKIKNLLNISQEDFFILQSYLIRLGVIEEILEEIPTRRMSTNVPKFHVIKGPTELTDLGYHFVKNCKEITNEKT